MELQNSLLAGWHADTRWTHVHMEPQTFTQVKLHLQMQTHIHKNLAHTHFTSICPLSRTAVVLRMS